MPYDDSEAQIAQLRATIADQEQEIAALESEITLLKEDLQEFTERYDRVVKPASNRLQAAKSALKALEDLYLKRQMGQTQSLESLWRDFASKIADTPAENTPSEFASTPELDDILPSATRPDKYNSGRLKTLYRTLARRFHPDTATDEGERNRCNRMMSLINAAYAEQDLETLRLLETQFAGAKGAVSRRVALVVAELRTLQQQHERLADRLRDLQAERVNLRYGVMTDLKTRAVLARFQGEDLLQRIADEMDSEYWELSAKITLLRQQMQS